MTINTRHRRFGPTSTACVWAAIACTLSGASHAAYRCEQNGKVVISDTPCAASAGHAGPNSPSPSQSRTVTLNGPAQGPSPYGEWRGQAQFNMVAGGRQVAEGHAVVPFTIGIDGQGKVVGASSANGCRVLGIASPHFVAEALNLDLTLSNCNVTNYNRRYAGSLIVSSRDRSAQLSLTSYDMLGRSAAYEVKSTLRR